MVAEDELQSLPDGWRITTLGELCDAGGGDIQTGPFGSQLHSADYVSAGVPSIMPTNILVEGIQAEGIARITRQDAERLQRYRVRAGDIVYSRRGDVEKCALVTDKEDGWLCGTGCLRVRLGKAPANAGFVHAYLSSPPIRAWVVRHSVGATMPNLNTGILRSLPLAVPPPEEMHSISAIWTALIKRTNQIKAMNQTLEGIARAIFKSWFVDFDPVRAKAEGREPEGMDADTAALFPRTFEDSELGPIPQGWKAVPFGALLESAIGGDWGKEELDEAHTEQVAIIRGTDMPTIQAGYTSDIPVRFVSAKKLQSRILRDSDIIIEVSGGSPKQPTGRSIFVSDALLEQLSIPTVPASFCRLFRATDPRVGLLLSQHLSHIYGEGKMWGYQNQSTGISNFQTKHFLESEYVCLPSDEVLDAFQQIIRPMIDRQQLKIASTLADLRDTLLPRLISGKLRVPEAEAMLTAV